MAAFTYRMGAGVPGDITRQSPATIESQIFDPNNAFASYGLFGKFASGKFIPVGSGDASAAVYGMLVRPNPITGANGSDPLGTSVPPLSGIANVLRRGYANVKSNAGTPALNGAVYIRVGNASTGKPISGIEAAAENTIASAAYAGNTGNGTLGTLSALTGAQPGAYNVAFVAATKFELYDPSGKFLGVGTTGTAFSSQVQFTITAGATAFVAGDGFTVTVTANTIVVPNAIFMGAADASGNAEIAYNI